MVEDVTGPAAGLCFHIKPKRAGLSAVHQGPPLAWVAYRHLHLPWKGSKDICFWQIAGPSVAADPPVNWAETYSGSRAFQSALSHKGLRSAAGFSTSFTAGSCDRVTLKSSGTSKRAESEQYGVKHAFRTYEGSPTSDNCSFIWLFPILLTTHCMPFPPQSR